MASSEYISVIIDGKPIMLSEGNKAGITISYKLEDPQDFTRKKSSEALSITIPATLDNDQASNSFFNPGIDDLTSGQVFKNARNAAIIAAGVELLVGKAFLTESSHTDRPISYEYDLYGNNGDWIIQLKETTLFDLLQHIVFTFTEQEISDSWLFDGRNEKLPYVFAPVRYRQPMDFFDSDITDGNFKDAYMTPLYMKPCISVYWIIYWAFQSIGYQIDSTFFNTDYFRRMVMPWTWGNFLNGEGNQQDNLKFLAKSSSRPKSPIRYNDFLDVKADNDSTDGGFDANGVYEYFPATGEMRWTYLNQFDYQTIDATFNLQIDWDVYIPPNCSIWVRVYWFLNGQQLPGGVIDVLHQSTGSQFDFLKRDIYEEYRSVNVRPADTVSAKIHVVATGTGYAYTQMEVLQFTLTDIAIPLGGTINFNNFNGLKNYKFLDFFAGVVDTFNLEPGTDSIMKVVTIEPTHPCKINDDGNSLPGYFIGDHLQWSDKQDLSKQSIFTLFRDYEREVTMKFKDDSNDGILKVVQDRNNSVLAASKYVLPDRFQAEKKEIPNRFFAPTMHCDVPQWQNVTTPGIKPQLVCIVPENISNTSNDESQNTFQPKLAYYKGIVSDAGGWRYKTAGGIVDYQTIPYLFAVNYQPGGEKDPILSYCDERIGDKIGRGLLRRFFLQRFAIMRNGQYYSTWFNLNMKDVTNWYHREHKICHGQRYELVEITDYNPISNESTKCSLRRWVPVMQEDYNAVYPSMKTTLVDKFDIKYFPLKCLVSDIPGPITN
ncbi:hypothetical protein ACE38W_00490 [Chitinophaga sp. Hz27]|uniref:hypothetical protein n=1 Tax=Chitinophaga sp. Hz27 TaxID=3347169 RepID=UPI0035D72AC2